MSPDAALGTRDSVGGVVTRIGTGVTGPHVNARPGTVGQACLDRQAQQSNNQTETET